MNTSKKYHSFDAADYVVTTEDAAQLLEVALEESVDDSSALPIALGVIARSGSMSELARRAGMSRDGLYRALSADGNPTWSTILKVTQALDLQIEVHPARLSA